MANRQTDFSPTVTNVVPQDPSTSTPVDFGADIADQVANISAQSKALQATAATSQAFRQLDTQFRLNNADNPNDPQALQDYRDARNSIIQNIGSQVPNITQRDYFAQTIELGKASDTSNQLWTTRQMVRNASNNVQTSYQSYMDQAAQAGKDFAVNGGDIADVLQYAQANQAIHKFADPVLGSDKTQEYLKNFNTDYVKSFVANVAEKNPQQAAALLQDPNISNHFTAQDIGDMAQTISRTQKQQALITSLQTTKNDGALVDIVNDPNSTYYEKRVAIDKMNMEGSVTPGAAAKALRVVTSTNDMESQTDTPQMADIINKAYDLNSQATTSPDDYLMGVRALQQNILDLQSNNQLTAQDAVKLNKQISNLTQSKLASATNSAGDEFYQANQQFNALPAEYRGQATRALFYASHGQNMTDQQLSLQANKIIDQINAQRRSSALVTVDQLQQPDAQFLKQIGVTQDKIEYTAKKYNMTPAAVMMQLRAQAAARARVKAASPIQNVAPEPADDQGGDLSTKTPAPPLGIQLPGSAEDNEQ